MPEAVSIPETDSHEVTRLLISWSDGDKSALDKLLPMIYRTLQKIARDHLHRERSSHTLQTTALVHEAYLKMVDQNSVQWKNRSHFFAIASQMIVYRGGSYCIKYKQPIENPNKYANISNLGTALNTLE